MEVVAERTKKCMYIYIYIYTYDTYIYIYVYIRFWIRGSGTRDSYSPAANAHFGMSRQDYPGKWDSSGLGFFLGFDGKGFHLEGASASAFVALVIWIQPRNVRQFSLRIPC